MQPTPPIKIAVTGAAGQISYSLLFRLAAGEVFGPNQPIDLHLIELPGAMAATEGVAMELADCAFPTLAHIRLFDNPEAGFRGVHWALLVGSRPRSKGMQRSDLVKINGPIFKQQGLALEGADATLRCVVVGNPCNTNALIALTHAKSIPPQRFFAMTALDENRARSSLAQHCDCPITHIHNLFIWGNHSITMVPDYENAILGASPTDGQPLFSAANIDQAWLSTTFMRDVQERGMKIIGARGKSSAASAASACLDTIKHLISGTPFSAGILSDGNPYGIQDGLVYSFPLQAAADGTVHIIPGFTHTAKMSSLIKQSMDELRQERAAIADLLTSSP